MIEAKKLLKIFKSGDGSELIALDHVDLSIPDGQFVAITGRSGSGKSTLLYQLSLLDRPTGGSIHLYGKDVLGFSEEDRTFHRLSRLGYVFQDYAILPSLTATENVMLPLLMLGLSPSDAKRKAEEALAKVGLGDRMINYPSQLSGGQQQRVSIARAIAHEPLILFADEPTANLDTETSKVILELFLNLHKEGQTIVMVTHEKDYAQRADRVIELADGKVIRDSLPERAPGRVPEKTKK